jgi:hypothetical protein
VRNVYRDPPVQEAEEPLPALAVPPLRWSDVLRQLTFYLVCALGLAVFSDTTQAAHFLVVALPGVLVVALIVALGAPVHSWLERRHARIVAQGIARLEASVAAEAPAGPALEAASARIRVEPHVTLLFDRARDDDDSSNEYDAPRRRSTGGAR